MQDPPRLAQMVIERLGQEPREGRRARSRGRIAGRGTGAAPPRRHAPGTRSRGGRDRRGDTTRSPARPRRARHTRHPGPGSRTAGAPARRCRSRSRAPCRRAPASRARSAAAGRDRRPRCTSRRQLHAGGAAGPAGRCGAGRRRRRRASAGAARRQGAWVGTRARRRTIQSGHEPPPARARQAVDDADLRRALDRPEVQRALPVESRQGADRAVDRVRPADADRIRPRSPAGARRGRQGRRPGGAPGRHGGAARRHPAGPDEHVDDDQRHRGLAAGAVHRHRRGSGPHAGPALRAPPRTTSSRSSSRAARTRSRPGPRCG